MIFPQEAIAAFLAEVPQESRGKVRELLNSPEKLAELAVSSSKGIPDEFVDEFDTMQALITNSFGEMTHAEMKEVNEITKELAEVEGHIAVDSKGNIYVEDEENGEEIDADTLDFLTPIESEDNAEHEPDTDDATGDTETMKELSILRKEKELIKLGVSPEKAEKLAKVYDPPDATGFGGKAKLEKYNSEFKEEWGLASPEQAPALPATDSSRHPVSTSTVKQSQNDKDVYDKAKREGDIDTVLSMTPFKKIT